MEHSHRYSVAEYENALDWGQRLTSSRARSFHEVIWTEGAPKPEHLTTEWQRTKEGRFRICDRDVYDAQMRRFIGLE